mgnify:CR=1 FL=1
MEDTSFLLRNYETLISMGLTTKEVIAEKLGEQLKSDFDKEGKSTKLLS